MDAPLTGIDWESDDIRRRIAGGRRQPLARACGLGSIRPLRLLDATGGYGRDAFVLAALGAEVTICERLPALADGLRSAHQRALESPALRDTAERMRVLAADSIDVLRRSETDHDVIYL
ncbi:class I SAM-dependent methyltransferase, partial [uncultured Abyssibacter sp.]|uniref:class I SAM-dependent methyltransferase n=1 Tax=uncultured Abyssibacter sp. TaxID=2320202 RepID=UPI0032B18988